MPYSKASEYASFLDDKTFLNIYNSSSAALYGTETNSGRNTSVRASTEVQSPNPAEKFTNITETPEPPPAPTSQLQSIKL